MFVKSKFGGKLLRATLQCTETKSRHKVEILGKGEEVSCVVTPEHIAKIQHCMLPTPLLEAGKEDEER